MRPLHEAYARDSSFEPFRKANFDVTSQSPADIQSVANEEIVLPDDTLQTITAMLRSAELEAGSAQTMDTEVNLASLLEEIAEIYEPVTVERGNSLIIRAQTISVRGNKSLLSQMSANLIESAISMMQTEQRYASNAEWSLDDPLSVWRTTK